MFYVSFMTQYLEKATSDFFKIKLSTFTMDFRPREALFFADNFFKLVTIGFKFSHHPFQPKPPISINMVS